MSNPQGYNQWTGPGGSGGAGKVISYRSAARDSLKPGRVFGPRLQERQGVPKLKAPAMNSV